MAIAGLGAAPWVAWALLIGCDGPRPAESPRANSSPAPVLSSPNAAPDSVSPSPLILTSSPTTSIGDPTKEGWATEAFSQVAVSQLQQLGKLLEHGEFNDKTQVASFIDEHFRSSPLLPDTLQTIYNDSSVRVDRLLRDPAGTPSTQWVSDPQQAMGSLLKSFADYPQRMSKFKLFRVQSESNEITTRQYFHFAGFRDDESREHNATWSIGWSLGHADGRPRIRWIQVEEVEQVTATVANRTWLVDCTRSLLDHVPAYSTALQMGIGHWQTRLESSLGTYNFGHHGLSIGDLNGDGLDDLYVCQTGGLPNHVFLQRPDGTLLDDSVRSQADFLDNTRSALLIDLDNDGDQDLVLSLASGLLFLENDGSAQFRQRARINSVRQAFSLAAADYDQDGWLDLYVCVYYASGDGVSQLPLPLPYFDATNGGQNYLIRNRGDWRFEDVTTAVGLDDDNRRFSFAAAWEDHDNDGDLDLLVVNDYGPNHLYVNDGGRFRNVANTNGLLDGAFGMSATWSDYDRDGDFDIYVANMFSAAGNRVTFQPQFKPTETDHTRSRFRHLARGNSLFRNRGDGTYEDVSVEMGVTMGRWSWGSLFADLNNDGWDDLLVSNGFITGTQTDDL